MSTPGTAPDPQLIARAFDAIPTAVYLTRAADGVVLTANAATASLTGHRPPDMIGRTVAELGLWADMRQRAEMLALLDDQGCIDHFTARIRHRDGRLIDVLSAIQAVDIDGERCLVTATHDVTERSRTEAALQRSERRLRQITETIDEGFLLAAVDPLHVLYATPIFAELMGTTVEAIYEDGASLINAIHPEDRAAVRTSRARMREGGRSDVIEARVRPPAGGERWVRFKWSLVSDDDSDRQGLVAAVAEDVTGHKRVEREATAARAQAERANRAKSTFLSRVSHELRTPLNAILGFGQLLESDELGPQQRETLDEMMAAGRHLLQMVDEILDLSHAEAGHLDITLADVAVPDVVRTVIDRIMPEAARRGIAIHTPDGCDGSVRGDRRRLETTLHQIVSNAVVHNQTAGTVRITCTPRPGGRVRILVEDTGPGLAPEELERAFAPFERPGARGDDHGTGLGLPLARRLIEAMGGELGAHSVPGRGSSFWIDLEATEADQRSSSEAATADGASRRVLYVEDNASNAALVTRALAARPSIELVVAPRGEQGLELLSTEPFDLVLLDLHLPDIDGEEVLRRMRAEPATSELPVVVISADASPDVISRLLETGAIDYLTKPVNIPQLLQVIDDRARPASAPDGRWEPGDPLPSSVPRPPLPHGKATGAETEALVDEAVLDGLSVLDEIEPGSVAELVELFAAAGRERVDRMGAVVADGSTEGIAELGHTLRGSGANLGAARLAILCRALEESARAGDLAETRRLVDEVTQTFDRSVSELRSRNNTPGGGLSAE